ncbi:MAG: glycosyltransferase family 4 protein [Armatimonadota bacterium]
MRIACVVGTYPTASETFIAREVEGLRARGHRVDIYSLFAPAEGPADGVAYGWTPAERLLRKALPKTAVKMLASRWNEQFRAYGVQAVLAHFGSQPSTVALQAAGDLPFFLSLHARDLYVEAEGLDEKLSRTAAVVTCTRANLQYLQEYFPHSAERIHLVYHGLPPSWLDAPVPQRKRAPGEALRILAVGRFVEKKGFAVLPAACALLRKRGIPFAACIVGEGPLAAALEADCRRLDLKVEFPGWLPEAELRQAYAAADVFCCPSAIAPDGDRDGLPNVLVEAMATGLPAVGSHISGIPEAIEHEATGLLVPPGDAAALAEALARCADPALRVRLGTHAAAYVREHFNADRGLDQLERLLLAPE